MTATASGVRAACSAISSGTVRAGYARAVSFQPVSSRSRSSGPSSGSSASGVAGAVVRWRSTDSQCRPTLSAPSRVIASGGYWSIASNPAAVSVSSTRSALRAVLLEICHSTDTSRSPKRGGGLIRR